MHESLVLPSLGPPADFTLGLYPSGTVSLRLHVRVHAASGSKALSTQINLFNVLQDETSTCTDGSTALFEIGSGIYGVGNRYYPISCSLGVSLGTRVLDAGTVRVPRRKQGATPRPIYMGYHKAPDLERAIISTGGLYMVVFPNGDWMD